MPAFEEICQRAALTEEQIRLFSTFNRKVKLAIQVNYCQLCMPDNDGISCLRNIAEKLEVLHGEAVTGAKNRFVEKMFGAHTLPRITDTATGFRIHRGSDEIWSTCYELELIVDFVRADYSVELEAELQNGKKPEFLARKKAAIYVEAKLLNFNRQMDIVFDEDPSSPLQNEDAERVNFTKEKELALKKTISQNLENASAKFDGTNVPHAIFVRSPWPPALQGEAILSAIEEFLTAPHPGLLGVAIDSNEGRGFWEVTPEGIKNTVYAHGCLPPVYTAQL